MSDFAIWSIEMKELIERYTGLERDALHIHAALLVYILAMAIFRQTRRSRIPWLVVLVAEVANEANDLTINWADGPEWALSASFKDLWNTMLWPTVLLFVGRYTNWFRSKHELAPRVVEPEDAAE